jgi:predicted RNA-binding protein with PUA-like domain
VATRTTNKPVKPAKRAAATKPAAMAPAKAPAKKATTKRPAASAAPLPVPTTEASEPRYWLLKSEASVYPWSRFVADGRTHWDGIRNFEARNNLRAMQLGDLALFYHSNAGKDIVGVARIVRTAYADPTAPGEDWSAVDLSPVVALEKPVSLATIKATPALSKMELLGKMRLSVSRVSLMEFAKVLVLGETSVP